MKSRIRYYHPDNFFFFGFSSADWFCAKQYPTKTNISHYFYSSGQKGAVCVWLRMNLLRGDLQLPLCSRSATIGCSGQAEMAEGLCWRPVTFPVAPLERLHWRKHLFPVQYLKQLLSEVTRGETGQPWALRKEPFPKPFESSGRRASPTAPRQNYCCWGSEEKQNAPWQQQAVARTSRK